MFQRLLRVLAVMLVTTCAFAQGVAGPQAGGVSYGNFAAAFAQPSVTWGATGLSINYSTGNLATTTSVSRQFISSGTLTATANATNYIYWSGSGGTLSITTTSATALAATWLYACVAGNTSISSCLAASSVFAPYTGGGGGGGNNPGGSGSELQYRAGSSSFGAVDGSSYDPVRGVAAYANGTYGPLTQTVGSGLWNPTVFGANVVGGDTLTVKFCTPPVATDPAAVGPIATTSLAAGGAGYAPGDTFEINWWGSIPPDAIGVVDTVDGGGAVVTYHLTNNGLDQDPFADVSTIVLTGGGDGNLAINVLTVVPNDAISSTSSGYGTGTVDCTLGSANYHVLTSNNPWNYPYPILIGDGLGVTFATTTGHTVGNTGTVTLTAASTAAEFQVGNLTIGGMQFYGNLTSLGTSSQIHAHLLYGAALLADEWVSPINAHSYNTHIGLTDGSMLLDGRDGGAIQVGTWTPEIKIESGPLGAGIYGHLVMLNYGIGPSIDGTHCTGLNNSGGFNDGCDIANNSSDTEGEIWLTGGASGTAAAGTAQVTFGGGAWPSIPYCYLTLVDEGAAWADGASARLIAPVGGQTKIQGFTVRWSNNGVNMPDGAGGPGVGIQYFCLASQ